MTQMRVNATKNGCLHLLSIGFDAQSADHLNPNAAKQFFLTFSANDRKTVAAGNLGP